jgi:membrane-associated protease RseP (regulator of RpoE activity)
MRKFLFFSEKPQAKTLLLHISLFILTFLTCSIAGTLWANQDFTDLANINSGFTYAVLILTFLSSHEFGHYIAARIHGVEATLPFYIPFPPFMGFPSFGTFGAVIKTRSPIYTKKALFDIGASGPLAGFAVCFLFLFIGLITLPPKEVIYEFHPEYITNFGGLIPATGLHFGDTLLYWIMSHLFANPTAWLPPMNEIYHYPLLNVGWFGLFVTSLNLLPFGQLDGGHIAYAMFGAKQKIIAKVVFITLLVIGGLSMLGVAYELLQVDSSSKIVIFLQNMLLPPLIWLKNNIPFIYSLWSGWLFWALLGLFVVKLPHPAIGGDDEINQPRRILGWLAAAILITSFSWNGIYLIE